MPDLDADGDAIAKVRAAQRLLAEASTLLSSTEPKQQWYDVNKLLHATSNWLHRWSRDG